MSSLFNWKDSQNFLKEIRAHWNTKSKRICTSGIFKFMSMFMLHMIIKCCSTNTICDQMCSKLGRLCDSNPELQTLLYFQFTNIRNDHFIYRAVVKEELSVPWTVDGSSFQVKDFWLKPLVACKADFICFGRYIKPG